MHRLASRAGLEIRRVFYDSTSFQFWASEQYRQDIPLRAETARAEDEDTCIFTDEEISKWEQQAVELNANADGDQAGFVLTG